jgi:hypothetical protein
LRDPIVRHCGRLVGTKDVITVIHIGKDGDLIIGHVREWMNVGEVKNHDPREFIGEISGHKKGMMRRRSGLVIFRCIKSIGQLDEEVTEAAPGIAKLDGAELGASGRLSSNNINGCSSAGFKLNDVSLLT